VKPASLFGVASGLALLGAAASHSARAEAPADTSFSVERLSTEESASASKPAQHPGDPRLVSFDEAITQILARSTAVSIQDYNAGAVSARDIPIRLRFVPSLSFDAKQSTTGGEGINSPYQIRQVEAVSQLNLLRWGADYELALAASSDEATQKALVDDTVLRTQDGAVVALVGYIQRKKEIAITQDIVRMQTDSLAIAQQRYAAGYLPLQEVEKVSVDLSNANSRLADAQLLSYQAEALLENLLGHTRVVAEWPWKERFASLPKAQQSVLSSPENQELARFLSRRPDWRAAEAHVEAEDRRLSSDWRLLLPSLDAQVTYGYYFNGLYGPALQQGQFGSSQWQSAFIVNFPFFDRLTLYSNAKAQAFVKSAAEASFEQVRRDAKSEWDSARQSFDTSLSSARVRDKTLATSRKVYQDNLRRFQNGRINANDLVLDQARLLESELFAVQGWATVHLAYSRLCKAQGFRLQDCRY
jgi:outer membrane protein TolC